MGTNSGIISWWLSNYVTFIDDATRKTWVYCIRQKYYVFATFKKWKYLGFIEKRQSLEHDNKMVCQKR